MGQPDGVGPDLQNEGNVLLHHFVGQGNACVLAVLMAGNATQRVAASIQEKALLGGNLKFPAAKAGRCFLAVVQFRRYGIEEGVINTIPQVGMVQRENRRCGAVLYRSS